MFAATDRASYWSVPLFRAVPAVVVGLAITFSADHTPRFGLLMLGSFAVATGLIQLWGALRIADRAIKGVFFVQAAVAIITGIAAFALNTGGLGYLLFLITAFFAITGFLELYAGIRARGRDASSRDWLIVGGFTAVASVVFLLLPLGSVETVGLFGAYDAVLGLFLIIAGLSLKWAIQDAESDTTDSAADPAES